MMGPFKQLLSIAFLMSLPLACFSQCESGRFSLRGRVVDGVRGDPLTDVRLSLSHMDWNQVVSVAPDSDGRFTFSGLGDCSYILQALLPNDTVTYGELPDTRSMLTVSPGPSEEDKLILFRVQPHSVITGVVRDEFGDAVEGVTVRIYRPAMDRGRVGLVPDSALPTDDLGRYRIDGLWPGNYVVCADPPTDSLHYAVPIPGSATNPS